MTAVIRQRPLLPFGLVFAIGLVLNGLGNWVWEPPGSAAVPVMVLAGLGAAVAAAVMLGRGDPVDRTLLWCGLVGGVLLGVAVLALNAFVDESDNSIGGWPVVLVAGLALFAAGVSARRDPVHAQ